MAHGRDTRMCVFTCWQLTGRAGKWGGIIEKKLPKNHVPLYPPTLSPGTVSPKEASQPSRFVLRASCGDGTGLTSPTLLVPSQCLLLPSSATDTRLLLPQVSPLAAWLKQVLAAAYVPAINGTAGSGALFAQSQPDLGVSPPLAACVQGFPP